jgi:hypothetical protein
MTFSKLISPRFVLSFYGDVSKGSFSLCKKGMEDGRIQGKNRLMFFEMGVLLVA